MLALANGSPPAAGGGKSTLPRKARRRAASGYAAPCRRELVAARSHGLEPPGGAGRVGLPLVLRDCGEAKVPVQAVNIVGRQERRIDGGEDQEFGRDRLARTPSQRRRRDRRVGRHRGKQVGKAPHGRGGDRAGSARSSRGRPESCLGTRKGRTDALQQPDPADHEVGLDDAAKTLAAAASEDYGSDAAHGRRASASKIRSTACPQPAPRRPRRCR